MAFLFPGEGSQYVGMLSETAIAFPEVRAWFDLLDGVVARDGRLPPSRIAFPVPGESRDELLWRMDVGPELLFAASQALLALLRNLGVAPHAVAGHSSGEYSALVAANALPAITEATLAADMRALHRVYQSAAADGLIPTGALLTVAVADRSRVDEVLARHPDFVLAMDNCPAQLVIAGPADGVAGIQGELATAGAVCEPLPFGRLYHTRAFAGFSKRVHDHMRTLKVSRPSVPVYSCATAAVLDDDPDRLRAASANQWHQPVRFRETVEAMHRDGIRIFVEVGPSGTLTAFVNDTLRRKPHLAAAVDARTGGLTQLNHLVARLLVHRLPVDASYLFRRRMSGSQAGLRPRSAPSLATDLPLIRLSDPPPATGRTEAQHSVGRGSGLDAVVHEHLRTMERFLAVQRELTMSYLGASDGKTPAGAVGEPVVPRAAAVQRHGDAVPESDGTAHEIQGRPPTTTSVATLLRDLLSARTGYPAESISEEIDLEAELGIDSIKRTEILAELQRRTGQLPTETVAALRRMRTICGIADAVIAALTGDSVPSANAERNAPFLDAIVAQDAERLEALTRLDVETDRFLLDHTVERSAISQRAPDLVGLPVLPLTVTIEIMAEAAATLAGGVVVALHDVNAYRWITFETGSRVLRVIARRRPDDRVKVTLNAVEEPDTLLADADVILSARYPDRPATPVVLPVKPSREARLYGPDGMFHGPAFQVVRALDAMGQTTATATLAPSGRPLLAAGRSGQMCTDPALLDGPGQVVAHLLARRECERVDIFPTGLQALEFYASSRESAAPFRCDVRVQELSTERVVSDIDLLDAGGRLVARLSKWADARLELPAEIRDILARPAEAPLARPWAAIEVSEGVHAWVVEPLPAVLRDYGEIWLRVIAFAVLGPAERSEWLGLRPTTRRLEWLAGRMAAKEAVRSMLRRTHRVNVAPADLTILSRADGTPCVHVTGIGGAPPLITISGANGLAVAVAADPRLHRSVGVDVRRVGSVRPEVVGAAFTASERQWLDSHGVADQPSWLARFCCAKEAARKAAGIGLALPLAAIAVRADHKHGLWRARTSADDTEIVIQTGCDGNLAYALALCVVGATDISDRPVARTAAVRR